MNGWLGSLIGGATIPLSRDKAERQAQIAQLMLIDQMRRQQYQGMQNDPDLGRRFGWQVQNTANVVVTDCRAVNCIPVGIVVSDDLPSPEFAPDPLADLCPVLSEPDPVIPKDEWWRRLWIGFLRLLLRVIPRPDGR